MSIASGLQCTSSKMIISREENSCWFSILPQSTAMRAKTNSNTYIANIIGLCYEPHHQSFGIPLLRRIVQLLKEIDSLRIDNEKSLQSYLYILTRERTIDFLRKWERRRGVLTDHENRSTSFDNFKEPEEIALTNLQLNKAVSILSDMPSIYRRTLVLRVKGYSIREIAQITNSSESNVKTRIHRARAILLKSFDT